MGNMIFPISAVVGVAAVLRHRYLKWGATSREQAQPLVGDDLLPAVDLSATRAITVDAPADAVWPWLVQLGQGRGGFYSYDWLENLVPHVDIHNAHALCTATQSSQCPGKRNDYLREAGVALPWWPTCICKYDGWIMNGLDCEMHPGVTRNSGYHDLTEP